ncbi:UBX domain-containing protein 2A-like [Myotis daubentonii]|uniref:UBX domain-containing protein 2A-like n=1 Tax=Myotis daubentonii TaxID=98922 RepID=UPI002873AB52|nr:UBX domain-containing protein 2A-like [Myotis daubentonii]
MQELHNLESIKEKWASETGSDNQPLSDNRQTTCEYFVDSLFEEGQKVGAKCLSPTEKKKQVDINTKLWKNGLTVNDDFRSYSVGASQQFLNFIKKGDLSSGLQGTFDKEEVDVRNRKYVWQRNLCSSHSQGRVADWEAPHQKFISKTKSTEVEKKNNLSIVPLNNLEPITNIQIWLASGIRIVQKCNMSHRISTSKTSLKNTKDLKEVLPFPWPQLFLTPGC